MSGEKDTEQEFESGEQSSDSAREAAVAEANAGQAEFVENQKAHAQYVKDGGKTGITGDFDKPVLYDSGSDQPTSTVGGGSGDPGVAAVQSCGEPSANTDLGTADFLPKFKENFDDLDLNNDGFISKEEIDTAIVDPCITGEKAQLVSTLRKNIGELEELSNDEMLDEDDGITLKDAEEFDRLQAASERDEDEQKLVNEVEFWMDRARRSIDAANSSKRQLFANPDDPKKDINHEGVYQGQVNDCYFMSSLAAYADTPEGKEAIPKMIQSNTDGSYTVTFPGDPEHPVTVSPITDAEFGAFAYGDEQGNWAAVLEKAYGQWNKEWQEGAFGESKISPHSAIPNGSWFSSAMEMLTGRKVDSDLIEFTSAQELEQDLITALCGENKRPVKCSGPLFKIDPDVREVLFFERGPEQPKLAHQHVYSVLAYDKDNQVLTLRDPYGRSATDGVFTMTLLQFMQEATNISYGQ